MEKLRTPFQGIKNVIRFNWHFYLIAIVAVIALIIIGMYFPGSIQVSTYLFCGFLLLFTAISLIVSFYVYDRSRLYEFSWLSSIVNGNEKSIINIHAGFDETSQRLQSMFPDASLLVLDFYDPIKHTEISIQRARAAYPAYPGTQRITTSDLPLQNISADLIFLIFAAHEIRNEEEWIAFFQQLHQKLTASGKVIIVEHLRDAANLFAYNIGFFHFYSRKTWNNTFRRAGFAVKQTKKINPFVSLFMLEKI